MKDFEDTDREGATMDSGKLNMAEEEDHGRPTPDAAVREAVEMCQCVADDIEADGYTNAASYVRTLLRAVQAPRFPKAIDWHRWYMERSTRVDELLAEVERLKAHRLTGEQAKAVKSAHTRLMVYACPADEDAGEALEAAFPEAFEGEG